MITFELYQDANNLWHFNGGIIPAGEIALQILSPTLIDLRWVNQNMASIFHEHVLVTNILKENGDPYTDLTELETANANFFVSILDNFDSRLTELEENSGGSPQVIDLLPGQYLSDVIQSITDASETKPYTINFYNHSKTINWETFTAKIHVPEYVNINFVGKMNCFNNDDFFTNEFSISKMFLGFDFSRDAFALSGLPSDTTSIALSSKFEEETSIDLISELNDVIFDDLMYESQPFIHVKETHQIFYIKPNNEKN